MLPLQKEINATIVIAAREVLRFFKDWKTSLAFSLMFPVLFLGILGGSIAQNLGVGLGYNYLQFALLGMIAATIAMNTMMSVTSLVEDRENDFTQEIFVAPISRYSIILGKIIGGSITKHTAIVCFCYRRFSHGNNAWAISYWLDPLIGTAYLHIRWNSWCIGSQYIQQQSKDS